MPFYLWVLHVRLGMVGPDRNLVTAPPSPHNLYPRGYVDGEDGAARGEATCALRFPDLTVVRSECCYKVVRCGGEYTFTLCSRMLRGPPGTSNPRPVKRGGLAPTSYIRPTSSRRRR